jgi:hypothetical protein
MQSLKDSMRWDEHVYGLECDLEVYNVVAVADFNMGAMENKGLNIFNTEYGFSLCVCVCVRARARVCACVCSSRAP